MVYLTYDKQNQTFDFPHSIDGLPSQILIFKTLPKNEFIDENGVFNFLKILEFITRYNLQIADTQIGVLRNGQDENVHTIGEVYAPLIRKNIKVMGDSAREAISKLIQGIIYFHEDYDRFKVK